MQVDVKHFRKPTSLLQWVGMNALIIYALAACEIFPAVVQGFYWRSPENNLVSFSSSPLGYLVRRLIFLTFLTPRLDPLASSVILSSNSRVQVLGPAPQGN